MPTVEISADPCDECKGQWPPPKQCAHIREDEHINWGLIPENERALLFLDYKHLFES